MYRIYFLREGRFVDSSEETETYTKKDLEEIKDSYNTEVFQAPIVIGHSEDIKQLYAGDTAPAYGFVEKLGLDKQGLFADVSLVQEFEELIEREIPPYKYISAAIYERNNPFAPVKGKKYLRHIAFLGSFPPAIKGLPPVAKLYSESNLTNTLELFNIDDNIKKIEKKMKKYMVDDFDAYEEVVTLPNPDTATPGEIKDFLDNNAFEFLTYILTEGEYGYPGEISEFDPAPSSENGYLFDSAKNKFSGIFYDDSSAETDGYSFEIKKSGEGWTSSYIPVNQEEEATDDFSEEEVEATVETPQEETEEVPLVEEYADEVIEEEVPLDVADESALAQGEIPEEEPEVELPESSDSEIELLRSETKNLRNEILKLKNELNEMKMEEYRAYSEQFSPILEDSSINSNQLASLLFELDSVFNRRKLTKAYSEVVKQKPVEILKKVLENTLEKVNTQKIVSYGEFMPEEEEVSVVEKVAPVGTVYSDEGLNTHRQVLEYCQKNNLDSNNISKYLEAYKAISK